MKIRIKLIGPGGELDRQDIEVNQNASTDVADGIYDAIGAWKDILAPGDTIRIMDVER